MVEAGGQRHEDGSIEQARSVTAAAPTTAGPTTGEPSTVRTHGNAYNIFILVLTVLSLAIMAALVLPLDPETLQILMVYDNVICFIFLADFTYNITGSHPRNEYFIHQRGWLDLLGSIPSLGFLRVTALLRLFRLSRLARIARLMSGKNKTELIADVVHNRGQYALFITMLLVMLVLTISSVLVLQFESRSPDANITTGGDALWWAVVTITTVGYGDQYPVTALGRLTGVAVMFAGVGIIGALASILASLLVSPASSPDEAASRPADPTSDPAASLAPSSRQHSDTELAETRRELALTRAEIAELRRQFGLMAQSPPGTGSGTKARAESAIPDHGRETWQPPRAPLTPGEAS
jgi:voltage-gated potassium channel